MNRRDLLRAGAVLAAAPLLTVAPSYAASPLEARVVARLKRVPGNTALQIDIDGPGIAERIARDADTALFCGSCFKTFVLAQYLRDVESGRLSETAQLAVDDSVRTLGSAAFQHLTGTAEARVVLEMMIAHSDNTATDIALKQVGPDRVRGFMRSIGLAKARIPNSTRQFFSYIAGYPAGFDMGWKGVQDLMHDRMPHKPRPAINTVSTMVCPPSEFVSYYKRALRGEFFTKRETLVEFKRILSMADAISHVVPPDTPAYGKGGSIDWNGFYCLAFAGQMVLERATVTVALLANWTGRQASESAGTAATVAALHDMLGTVYHEYA